MRAVHVTCSREIIERIRATAVTKFPREMYAVLLGRRRGNRVSIQKLWLPGKHGATGDGTQTIIADRQLRADAETIAKHGGFEIVGDVHSHPYGVGQQAQDGSPSRSDWEHYSGRYWITAICSIKVPKRGKPSIQVHFWPWIQRLKLTLLS